MKELKAKLSRYLSAILMVAMVITSTPQAAMATIQEESIETASDNAEPVTGVNPDDAEPVTEVNPDDVEPDAEVNPDDAKPITEMNPNNVEPTTVVNPDNVLFDNPDGVTINVSEPTDIGNFDGITNNTIVSDNIVFTLSSPDSGNCQVEASCSSSGVLTVSDGVYTFSSKDSNASNYTIHIVVKWSVTIRKNTSNVKYKNSEGLYVDYPNSPIFVSGGSLDFKVTEVEPYEISAVKCDDIPIQKNGDGVYTLTDINKAKTIIVYTRQKPKVTIKSVGAIVSYNTTGAGDAYITCTKNTTEVSISTNATIYFKATPTSGYKMPIITSKGVEKNGDVYSKTISGATTIDVTATAIEPTVSFDLKNVTVKYNTVSEGDAYDKTYDGTPIIIPNGKIFFKLTADAGYEEPFTVTNALSGTGYYYKQGLTAAGSVTTITASATPMKTVSFKTDSAVVTYDTVSTNRLPDGSFSKVADQAIPVAKNAKLWFDVKPATNYTKPITVSDGNKPATSENGIYYAEVKDGKDHEIDVTATPITHTVSFDCVSGNFADEGIVYTIGGETPNTKYNYNQSLDVHQGKTVKFKLNLNGVYEKPVVKAGDVVLRANDYGIYSYTIAEDTTFSITTSKKATISFNIVGDNPFGHIYYGTSTEDVSNRKNDYLTNRGEIPVTTGTVFYYSFDLNEKYNEDSLSVKINGKEQTPRVYDGRYIYQKSGIAADVIITATAKVQTFDITFENPTGAMIETISDASVPNANFTDKSRKLSVDKNDEVRFKVTPSGNYVGREVTVVAFDELNREIADPILNGEVYSVKADGVKTLAVLPRVHYTFTNSGNAITFCDTVDGTFIAPQTASSDDATISQLNIASGTDYFFKVTPDSDKAIDYVRIDDKDVTAVTQTTTSSIYKVNAKVDTAIEVMSDTAYTVTFNADNGAVAKVGKDKKDTDYSETISNNKSKVLAGAQEFKFKAQAADSYKITSVSVNGASVALTADKDGVYTLTTNVVTSHPTVTIKSEKQEHKVTFYNSQKAEIRYTTDGTTVSAGSPDAFRVTKKVVDKVVVGSTFMVEAPEGSRVMKVVRGKNKAVTEIIPDASGIYTIDSLNADEKITVTCRKNATGIKYNKSILSENEIEQIANTVVTYKMDVMGVDKNFNPSADLLLVEAPGSKGSVSMSKVDYNTINVKVTTPYEYSDDATADVVFDLKEGNDVLKTIKVTAAKPVLKAPSVAVSDIRDDSAVLTLTDKSKQVINEGQVYYHISATKQVSEDKIDTIDLATLNGALIANGAFAVGKDIYVPAVKASKTFATKVEVNFRELGSSDLDASTGYNVSVNACISKGAGTGIYLDDSASTMLKKSFNLNASKYETNLKLGKASSKYITEQMGIPIAKVIWSKETTYRELDYIMIHSSFGHVIGDDELEVRDDIIYLKDTRDLYPAGTYTVEARPKSKKSNASITTLEFKVVQGIENLYSYNTEISILRAKGKKVTYQLPALIYNHGVAGVKPDSKNVTYTLSRDDGKILTANDKLIKVARGKVTIDKKYVFNVANPVKYKVTVKANDYKENSVSMAYTFTIKETGTASLKYLYICELVDNQYKPLDSSVALGSGEYYIIATKDKVTQAIAYNSDNIIKTSEYSMKCSNSKIDISPNDSGSEYWADYAYEIEPRAYAKNVTFTATAIDGSKAKISLKKVTFEDYPEDLWFDVYMDYFDSKDVRADGTQTIKTSNNETFCVEDYAKFAGVDKSLSIDDNTFVIDYRVRADKGLKIVNSYTGVREVLFTGKTLTKDGKAIGSLTYTYYKLEKGKRVKVTKRLTIVNENKWIKAVAPSAKQFNTLYAVRTSPQSISFNVSTKELPVSANIVRITPASKNMKRSLYHLYENSKLYEDISIADGTFNLSLLTYDTYYDYNSRLTYVKPVEAGTYKYIITYGHIVNGVFVEDTGTTTLKIKVTNEKAKVATSYAMSEVVPSVAITGKFSAGTTVTGTDLWNANIHETINGFKDYFELSADGKSIELKAAKGIMNEGGLGIDTEAEAKALQETIAFLSQKANKNDLIGYLSYIVDDSNITDTIKITMKVDTNATSAKAFKAGKKTVPVSGGNIELKYNKQDTKYAFAYTDAGNASVSLNAAVDHKGDVIISGKNAEETGTVKGVYVYVLKADSPYVTYVDTLSTPAAKNAAIEKYGVKVKLGKITLK